MLRACIKEYRENYIDVVDTEAITDKVRRSKGCDWHKMPFGLGGHSIVTSVWVWPFRLNFRN